MLTAFTPVVMGNSLKVEPEGNESLIFLKVSFLHTSFPRQSCHTALVAAPAQAPAR